MILGEGAKRRTGLKVLANTWFLCLGQACVFPHLTRYYDLDLHLSDFHIGLMMALPALGAVLMQPLWGILAVPDYRPHQGHSFDIGHEYINADRFCFFHTKRADFLFC